MCERIPERYVWVLQTTRGNKASPDKTYETVEAAKAAGAGWLFMEPEWVPWVEDGTHTRITAEVDGVEIVITRFPIQGTDLPVHRLSRPQ